MTNPSNRPSAGRSGRPWRRIRARVLSEETACFCGRLIDRTLPPGDPMSATVDHIVPLIAGGDPYERSNLRAAHRSCNSARRHVGDEQVRARAVREERTYVPKLPRRGPAPWH